MCWQDITGQNTLVNYFRPSEVKFVGPRPHLAAHMHSQDVVYAIFDYDLALPLDPGLPLASYRLPGYKSFCGDYSFQPEDAAYAQLEYNPFAFDVACLGNIFIVNHGVR